MNGPFLSLELASTNTEAQIAHFLSEMNSIMDRDYEVALRFHNNRVYLDVVQRERLADRNG